MAKAEERRKPQSTISPRVGSFSAAVQSRYLLARYVQYWAEQRKHWSIFIQVLSFKTHRGTVSISLTKPHFLNMLLVEKKTKLNIDLLYQINKNRNLFFFHL